MSPPVALEYSQPLGRRDRRGGGPIRLLSSTFMSAPWYEATAYAHLCAGADLNNDRFFLPAFGPELITNGTFDADITGWSNTLGGTWSAGAMRVTSNGTQGQVNQAITTVVGKLYALRFDGAAGGGATSVVAFISTTTSFAQAITSTSSITPATGITIYFTATTTTSYVHLRTPAVTSGHYGEFDNVSVKEVILTPEGRTYGAELIVNGGFATEPTLGSELIVNGDFATGATYGPELIDNGDFSGAGVSAPNYGTGWVLLTGGAASSSISGGNLKLTGDGAAYANADQSIDTEIGAVYEFTLTVGGDPIGINVGTSLGSTQIFQVAAPIGTWTYRFVATATTTFFRLHNITAIEATVDNFTVKKLTQPTGWTLKTQNSGYELAEIASGVLNLKGDGTNFAYADQSFATVIGQLYALTYTTSGSFPINLGTAAGSTAIKQVWNNNAGTHTTYFVAISTTTWIRPNRATNTNATLDNISIKPVSNQAALGWMYSLGSVNAPATISGGVLNLTGDGTNSAYADQSFTTVNGQVYEVAFTVGATNAAGLFFGTTQGNNNVLASPASGYAAATTHTFKFVAAGATTWARFSRTSTGTCTVDNVSIRNLTAIGTYPKREATFDEWFAFTAASDKERISVDSDGVYRDMAYGRTNYVRNSSMQAAEVADPTKTQMAINGDFAIDQALGANVAPGVVTSATAGWSTTGTGAALSSDGTSLRLTANAAGVKTYVADQGVGSTLTIGKLYEFTATTTAGGGTSGATQQASIRVRNAANNGNLVTAPFAVTSTGRTFTVQFIAEATNHVIRLEWVADASADTTTYVSFNTVSVKEVTNYATQGWILGPTNGAQARSIASGVLNLTGDGTNQAYVDQFFTTVVGRLYTVKYDTTANGVACAIGVTQGATTHANLSGNGAGISITFQATTTTTWVRFYKGTAALVTIDNVVISDSGKLPTYWVAGATSTIGVGLSVVALANEVITLRWSGWALNTNPQTITPDNGPSASIGETWTNSVNIALISGSVAAAGLTLRAGAEGGGTSLTGITSTLTRYSNTRTLTATAEELIIRSAHTAATAVDYTLAISEPQTELATAATPYTRTIGAVITGGVNLRRRAYANSKQQLRLEDARTNSIRNSAGRGGGAGTMPTYWTTNGFAGTGLNQTVIGTGTERGIEYIEIRCFGTVSGTAANVLYFDVGPASNGYNVLAAVTGALVSHSVFMSLVGGSFANVGSLDLALRENDATPAFLRQTLASVMTAGSSLTRFNSTVTLGASTTGVASGLRLGAVNGSVIDFTVRIGWPVLEAGAYTSNPIRTAGLVATRAAEAARFSPLNEAILGRTQSSVVVRAQLTATTTNNGRRIIGSDTSPSIIHSSVDTAAGAIGTYNGTTSFGATSPTTGVLSPFGAAMGFDAAGRSIVMNGGTVGVDALAMGSKAAIHLGRGSSIGASTPYADGYYDFVGISPERLANSNLQALAVAA